MAFGHEDTDEVYDKFIKPVLASKGIRAVRIDRIQHQERIDQFIIDKIRSVDLAIADLTYARPSVYYEAGFAERSIPVIYTCREDHFSPTISDDGAAVRIHFDLMTKNIVRDSHWTILRFDARDTGKKGTYHQPKSSTLPRRLIE